MMKLRTALRLRLSKQLCSALISGLCLFCLAQSSYSQEKINLSELLEETQQMSTSSEKITQVWWIPEQYWEASLTDNATMTQEQIAQFLAIIRPYTLIAVVDGKVGLLGGIDFTSEAIIRRRVIIQDSQGTTYKPMNESTLDPEIKGLLAFIKPILVNAIGPVGENIHFLVFKSTTEDGKPIADATKEGFFIVDALGEEFKYKLPLGSVLPPKYDPQTGEKFPGNYNYNPFTGSPLVTKSSSTLRLPLQSTILPSNFPKK